MHFQFELLAKVNTYTFNKELLILDSMLGWLARWCRLLGLDVSYSSNADDYELITRDGLLITRDQELYRSRRKETILLLTDNHDHWLLVLAKLLKIELSIDFSKTKCTLCGGPLREVEPKLLTGKVPRKVLEKVDKLWICESCGKIYWIGKHHVSINRKLSKCREMLRSVITINADNQLYVIYTSII